MTFLAPQRRWLRFLCAGLALALVPRPAAAQEGTGDVVLPPPPPRCIDDPASARAHVEGAFAELQKIHRGRVPGPSGQGLVDGRVNELLARLIAFDRFVDLALGDAWDKAEPQQKEDWRAILEQTLRRRYLRKLGSPLGARMQIVSVRLRCDRAEVSLIIVDRDNEHPQDVVLQLIARVVADDVEWRAFDVAVDGVSLLETWKSRFRRIYADGGVAAIDHHLRGLQERNRPRHD